MLFLTEQNAVNETLVVLRIKLEIALTTVIIAILYDYKCIYSFRGGQHLDIIEIFKALADETKFECLTF